MASVPYIFCISGLIKRQPKLLSNICASVPNGLLVLEITQGPRVMLSTPPAIKIFPSPDWMARAALITADIPEAHKRFTVSPGTV